MKLRKWQRVLDLWSQMGRNGMTIQQLSAITGISGERLLRMIRSDRNSKWQICRALCAPVIGWSQNHNGFKHEQADILAKILLEKYPTPKYKGIRNWKGVTYSGDGMTAFDLKNLEEA